MPLPVEEATVVPCTSCGMYDSHGGFEVHPQGPALLESVQFMLRHGKSPAQVIQTLLGMYGEDLPEPYTPTAEQTDRLAAIVTEQARLNDQLRTLMDGLNGRTVGRALLRERRRTGAPLGLS